MPMILDAMFTPIAHSVAVNASLSLAYGSNGCRSKRRTVENCRFGTKVVESTRDMAHDGPILPPLGYSRLTLGARLVFGGSPNEEVAMLWTIFVILLVLWLLGVVTSYTLGGFIHVLLVIAIIMAVMQLIQGRRAL
jgi:hypothetical protein